VAWPRAPGVALVPWAARGLGRGPIPLEVTVGKRTDELEIKIAYLEKLIADLDEVVRQQADRLDALGRDMVELRDEILPMSDEAPEAPPHY
jgi:uncharacterized coiled-coil protein SlyX